MAESGIDSLLEDTIFTEASAQKNTQNNYNPTLKFRTRTTQKPGDRFLLSPRETISS